MEIRDKHAPRLINRGATRPAHPPSGAALIGQSGRPHRGHQPVPRRHRAGGPGHGEVFTRIWGARHGVAGVLKDDLLDLGRETEANLERVAVTPAAALGSVRKKPTREECLAMFETFRRRDIRYLFYIGGNDSAETANIVLECARNENYPIRVFHVPKTIDNDLRVTDHCPGYGSAAKFVAQAFIGDNLDNRSLPGIKINIVMGRHAGS